MSPPFQRDGTQILKISKRVEPEKKWGWRKLEEYGHSVFPLSKEGGTQILKIYKRGEEDLKKEFRGGETKRGEGFQNERRGTNFSS